MALEIQEDIGHYGDKVVRTYIFLNVCYYLSTDDRISIYKALYMNVQYLL